MTTVIETDLSTALEQLRLQIADLATRLELLEQCGAAPGSTEMAPAQAAAAEGPAHITEEELIAISAALGAYLGVRAHPADSIGWHIRMGTRGTRIDSGVTQIAGLGSAMKLNITIDGKTYEVDVDAEEPESPANKPYGLSGMNIGSAPLRVPAGAAPVAPPADSKSVNEEKVCRSPVSGVVVRVVAQVGQSLQAGDILVVLEAMKMETNITAPGHGKIAAIAVNQGDGVQAGQVVVEFE